MKRDELKALGLTDEQIDNVMRINGADIEAQKAIIGQKDTTIQTLTTERDGFKAQVTERDKDIATLQEAAKGNEGISAKLTELQTKYDQDTAALQQRLDDQARDHAADSVISGYKFTSALAKKAVKAEFLSQNPEFKDGKFANAEAIMKQISEQNADAFIVETPPQPNPQPTPPAPAFTGPMGGGNGPTPGDPKNTLPLNLRFVRQPQKNE